MEDIDNIEEEDVCGFSRNYFLAKELGGASKRSAHKLSDIHIVDEQELRETASKWVNDVVHEEVLKMGLMLEILERDVSQLKVDGLEMQRIVLEKVEEHTRSLG